MAHRNYISVFDMSAGNGKGEWTSHFSISNKSYVRDIVIQRLLDPEIVKADFNKCKRLEKDLKFHGKKV